MTTNQVDKKIINSHDVHKTHVINAGKICVYVLLYLATAVKGPAPELVTPGI